MEKFNLDDLQGGISQCLLNLKASGFDASAYEIAKWAGVACLGAILVLILATFVLRSLRDKELPAALSEPQFALTILIAAVLIALPVVAKISNDKLHIDLGSGDIEFARKECKRQQDAKNDAIASDAQIETVERQVAALKTQLIALAEKSGHSLQQNAPEGTSDTPSLLGESMAVYYRDQSEHIARTIEANLEKLGAGVALSNTDLTESSLLKTAVPGDIYIVYARESSQAVKVVTKVLNGVGLSISDQRGPFELKGPPLQILVF